MKRPPGREDMTLLEFLRQSNAKGEIIHHIQTKHPELNAKNRGPSANEWVAQGIHDADCMNRVVHAGGGGSLAYYCK